MVSAQDRGKQGGLAACVYLLRFHGRRSWAVIVGLRGEHWAQEGCRGLVRHGQKPLPGWGASRRLCRCRCDGICGFLRGTTGRRGERDWRAQRWRGGEFLPAGVTRLYEDGGLFDFSAWLCGGCRSWRLLLPLTHILRLDKVFWTFVVKHGWLAHRGNGWEVRDTHRRGFTAVLGFCWW